MGVPRPRMAPAPESPDALPALPEVSCLRGDITTLEVDGIVNAASAELRGGEGVDGAIHAAAGPGLVAELRALYPHGGRTGGVYPTRAHDLPAAWILHAVGPIWRGGGEGEAEALAACYRDGIRLATELGLGSLAFPAISCGVYGYPHHDAARVAIRALAEALPAGTLADVRIVLFSDELLKVFSGELEAFRAGS